MSTGTRVVINIVVIFIAGFFIMKRRQNSVKYATKIQKEAAVVENINLIATLKTSKGDINIKLFPNETPFTVLNFVNLAKKGYYDGLKFHRVIGDFMIQGGCPQGTGTGGPGYNFKDEFVKELIFDKPGILAMANSGPNTNGSQFFITHVETQWLNHKHSIFGEVVAPEDQEVVNKVVQNDIIETIVITGDVKEFLAANEELINELDTELLKSFPDLK